MKCYDIFDMSVHICSIKIRERDSEYAKDPMVCDISVNGRKTKDMDME